jgi:hypothetical protein
MGGGYGRWVVFQMSTRVPYRKKPGKWMGKPFSAAAGALAFSCVVVLVPPPAFEVTEDLD